MTFSKAYPIIYFHTAQQRILGFSSATGPGHYLFINSASGIWDGYWGGLTR
jgi:hypothetical protein